MRRAWMFAGLLAACGDDGVHHLRDASPDGSEPVDAATADAPPAVGAVTVHVTFLGDPFEAATVFFIDPDGTAQTVLADATGTATATVTAGASVSVVDPHEDFAAHLAKPAAGDPPRGQVYTILAVAPGDDLHIDTFPPNQGKTPTATMTVTVPDLVGASSFFLSSSSCPGTQLSAGATSVAFSGCFSATQDFLLVPVDGDFGGNAVGSILLTNQALTDGGNLTFTAPYAPLSTFAATVNNLPQVDGDAGVTKTLVSPLGATFGTGGTATVTDHTATATFSSLDNTGLTQVVETDYAQGNLDSGRIVQWGTAADDYTFDAGPAALASFATFPSVDGAAKQVAWTESTGGATPDGIALSFQVTTVTEHSWRWFVVAPGSQAGAVQLPTLPDDAGDYSISADDTFSINQLEITTVTGGYRTYVQLHPWRDIDIGLPVLASPGTSGTAVSTILGL